ncbi:MAG: hypothetical protein M1824_001452 [Vezdaea acicularis]|nr:MAG: hypothetical protein M1824_001452 [Vezdaea acicularis]
MPYALKNRKVLVTGGSRGLGAVIARKFAEEGCAVAINYSSNVEAAENTVMSIEKDCGVKCIALKGVNSTHNYHTSVLHQTKRAQDMGKLVDCVDVVQEAIKQLRGLDILISNAPYKLKNSEGWTKFSRFGDLDALSEEDWDKCWSVNVKGPMFLLREALPTFNANTDGGVFLMTSSIAGVGTSGSTMAYAVSKAAVSSPG